MLSYKIPTEGYFKSSALLLTYGLTLLLHTIPNSVPRKKTSFIQVGLTNLQVSLLICSQELG